MTFQIDVGSDLFGQKHNTTLSFPRVPSVPELTAATESYFDTKSRACRPAGYPDVPFKIETFQLFDDTLLRWVDLYDAQQLRHGQQLWCFQPESIWHSDAQGVIPQAEEVPVTWTTPADSPRRRRQQTDTGVPPTLSEKLRSVFYQCDSRNNGYILPDDIENAFRRCHMEFTHGTASEIFRIADANSSGHITYDEWVSFAIRCPQVVDALFFRFRDLWQDQGAALEAAPTAEQQQTRQQELRGYYQGQWGGDERARQQLEYDAARAQQKQVEAQAAADAAARKQADAAAAAQRARAELAAAEAAAAQAEAEQSAHQQSAQQAAQEHAQAMRAAQERQAAQEESQRQQQLQQSMQQQQLQQSLQQQQLQQSQMPQSQMQQSQLQQSQAPQQFSPQHQQYPSQSPQREQALRDYEAAKQRAESLRAQKEEAERMERDAWTKLFYSPGSPNFLPPQ
eukprot:Hpha_TRINITY_DN4337_c0_g1::TRINITY_DN4337_c0_g1_i1::g.49996::m.49996